MKEDERGLYYGSTENSYRAVETAELMRKIAKAELPKAVENRERFERHLILSDYQIPDHDVGLAEIIRTQLIPDLKPDVIHLDGDIMNFSEAGKYDLPLDFDVTLGDELNKAKEVVYGLEKAARKANPDCEIEWREGNHEFRLQKYLARNAQALAEIFDEYGDRVITIPHLMNLKEHDIKWIPYYEHKKIGSVEIEHGDIVRSKSGYTAHAMLDRRGHSGFSGHTHRLAFITRNQGGDEKFWLETGSLCNYNPTPQYVKDSDWVKGFAVGIYDKQTKIMHPCLVMVQKEQFAFNNKVYESG